MTAAAAAAMGTGGGSSGSNGGSAAAAGGGSNAFSPMTSQLPAVRAGSLGNHAAATAATAATMVAAGSAAGEGTGHVSSAVRWWANAALCESCLHQQQGRVCYT